MSSNMPILYGHFIRWNTWTEIDSPFEGRFLERVAPGAISRTIKEDRDSIRVLFDHGHDPTIGKKPLGPLRELSEDSIGAYYEAPLLDTQYNRELLPGLQAGLYGASFRFAVRDEHRDERPARSSHNPGGIPERTIQDMQLSEFGPVVFAAYRTASASVAQTAPGPRGAVPTPRFKTHHDWMRWLDINTYPVGPPNFKKRKPAKKPSIALAGARSSDYRIAEAPQTKAGVDDLGAKILRAALRQDKDEFRELAEKLPGGVREAQELVRSNLAIRYPGMPQLKYDG